MLLFSMPTTAETKAPDRAYTLEVAVAFDTYCNTVYRLAYIRSENKADAEDIMSEVFLRLIKNADKIKSEEHLKAWLIRATISCSNSFFKRAKYRAHLSLEDAEAELGAAANENEHRVLPLVLALPAPQKTVVYMHYFEGYSVEETARLCGIPQGTVKSRLARARKALKTAMKGEL